MAMEQLYGDYDSSYNELQGWIAAMREYVPGTVIELQTGPTFDPSYEIEPHIFRQRMIRHESDMVGRTNTSFRQWLATLMPRMGQQQVDQMEARHMFIEHVRDVMVANHRMVRSMNVEIYSRRLETFRVTETISRRPGASDDFRASPRQRATEESKRSSAIKQNP
ncbi:hypothetical protein GOBAR_DD19288 [Gossypium barbadense]|nr:hypothetical protein GOBAR_DD19288 [Gossypium barbadense]